MILIADSGSTKTDWCVADCNGLRLKIQTEGINPFFLPETVITEKLTTSLLPQLPPAEWETIFFYGAGCTPEKAPEVARALACSFPALKNKPEVHSDMLAAARALCGHEAGIACILGTGSNSCFYDGERITRNVSPLGFILGDEGSGAVLGKLLVGDLLKDQLPASLKEEFLTQFNLTTAGIIDRVYRQPFPNRFLASLSPFLAQHLNHPAVRNLVKNSFLAFFQRNVIHYDYHKYPVHFIGSVAYHYQDILKEAAREAGVSLGKIAQSPLEGLVQYHTGKMS